MDRDTSARKGRRSFLPSPAFTLLELLVVIFLLSILAMLVFGFFTSQKVPSSSYKIENIRHWPSKIPLEGIELLCLDNCRKCFFRDRQHQMHKTPISLEGLQAYTVDAAGEPWPIDFGRLKDQKICLRFAYLPDGVTDRMILKLGNDTFYVPSYFGEVKKFSSLEEAVSQWKSASASITHSEDYY